MFRILNDSPETKRNERIFGHTQLSDVVLQATQIEKNFR